MSGFSIGLSGLQVAQRAIELISSNISNVSTEGYHRQVPIISSVDMYSIGSVSIGGAEITSVRRQYDSMLEGEIINQQSGISFIQKELEVLRAIESAFGQFDGASLGSALNDFFNSLTELSVDPTSSPLQRQVVSAAETLAGDFQSISTFLVGLQQKIQAQVNQYVKEVNQLTEEIGRLNYEISVMINRGGSANILQDQRDQAIFELSKLVEVSVSSAAGQTEVSNVSVWGNQVAGLNSSWDLELRVDGEGKLAIGVGGSSANASGISGGILGALINLKNSVIPKISEALDNLANQIITQINQLHVQGIGSNGSFTELDGVQVETTSLKDWAPEVSAGSFYVRITEKSTGQTSRYEISVDPNDTVSDIAARLDNLPHLSAAQINGCLNLDAEAGYTFDFLPALESTPYSEAITGSSSVTISGQYTGSENQNYRCEVAGSGRVGVDSFSLNVYDKGGVLVNNVNIDGGYVSGEPIHIGQGIYIALSVGDLNNGDEFRIQAISNSDTSGFLAAAGLNTFFTGNSASTIRVCSEISEQPSRLATAGLPRGIDNTNLIKMASVSNMKLAGLSGTNPLDYYLQMAFNLGQEIVSREARLEGREGVMQQLRDQREKISGVDLNDEAAQLIIFERMYQAASKVISTQNQVLQYLFNII